MAGAYSGLELLATAVVLLDERFTVIYANPAAENLLEIGARALAGQRFPVLFAEAPELERALAQAVSATWDYATQDAIYEPQGRDPLPLACVLTRVDHGEAVLLVELRPIAQQLRMEREERLLDQQIATRELIRNLAHEIKNPLGGLRGSAQLLERELERSELMEYTQVIIKEADRLQALLDRLLTPQRPWQPAKLNIHEVFERVRTLVLAEFEQKVAILCNYDPSVPDLDGDREQLIQALLNVARNAAQALTSEMNRPWRKGTIIFRTRVARQVTVLRQRYRLALELQVIDDGPGVPEGIRDRIFSPLVSGREGGTGLGLSLAQTLISNHHGVIECASRPGRTVFTILLPLA
ncbi:MAG TPA: nitrogen regulation protein NR(II) [Burkholderiales bacterium]|jgi:two-component system nitrogen regulation sensor histidine kinase GlnL|nr:nitrogen regulation protein NR(II) [Burkholderiales bacterium]